MTPEYRSKVTHIFCRYYLTVSSVTPKQTSTTEHAARYSKTEATKELHIHGINEEFCLQGYNAAQSVDYQRTTLRYIPEDGTLYNHRYENLKSYNYYFDYKCRFHFKHRIVNKF
jgi:hypothetical protein